MLPIKLTLKGIYSYREEQTIQFDKLTEAHIFGIFGSVGSGKSTILEAITFALYGDTERLNLRENRAYNMMNLKSNEMKVDFEFTVAEHDYKVTVTQKRKKKFAEIDSPNRVYYKKKGDTWEAQEEFNPAEVIGLSYENFRRTIIIPQGKFQEFLQLSATDRSRMLSEIFSLQKYDLGDKVGSLTKKNEAEILVKQTQLSELGNIDAFILQDAENEISKLSEQTFTRSAELIVLRQEFQSFEALKLAFEKQNLLKSQLDSLLLQEVSIQDKAKLLADFEACQLAFKNLFEHEIQGQKDLLAQSQQIQVLEKEQVSLQMSFAEINTQFALVEKEYLQREVLRVQSEDLVRISEILKASYDAAELEKRKAGGLQKFEELKALQILSKEQSKILADTIKSSRAALPDASLITEINLWFTNKNSINSVIQSLLEQEGQSKAQQREYLQQKEALLTISDASLKNSTDILNHIAEIEAKINSVSQSLKVVEVRNQLEQYAHNLHDGEACPLCGALEHPDVLKAGEAGSEVKNLQLELELLQANLKKTRILQTDFAQLTFKEEELDKTLSQIKVKLDKEKQVLKDLLLTFKFEGFSADDEKASATLQEKLKAGQNQIGLQESQLEKLLQEIDLRENEIKKFEDGFAKIDKLIDAELQKKGIRLAELKTLRFDDFLTQDAVVILAQAQTIQNQIIETEKQFRLLEQKRNQIKEDLLKTETTLAVSSQNLVQLQARLDDNKLKIEAEIKKSSFVSRENILQILSQNINVAFEKQLVDKFNQDLAILKDRFQESNLFLAGKTFDEQQYQVLKQNLSEAEIALKELESQKSVLISKLTESKHKLERVNKINEELLQLNLRKENLIVLAGLFRQSGFVRYVSNIYLQQLCNAANTRFHKLTRQSLQLEVDDKENLNVRDFLNDGQVRSVKTLSGGQTFQASLCLALALADSIQSLTKSDRNFFFLDEGFGSLDKDSLQTVFETLKSLRKENRIVGVISHVEDLQQEIDNYLTIKNDPETGSIVKGSWE